MIETEQALFSLRPARESDMPYICSYAYAEGMDNPDSAAGITVAVNDEDIPVAFCRVAVEESAAYIQPIAVTPGWRRFGVGRALVEDAAARHGELRLVARGASVPFYRALGFSDCPWEMIARAVANDCDGCEMRDECRPQPLWRK